MPVRLSEVGPIVGGAQYKCFQEFVVVIIIFIKTVLMTYTY
jgi:hypothetical protein